MKLIKSLFFLSITTLLISCGGGVNNKALISGTIENGGGKTLYLEDLNTPQSLRIGTVKINNDGTFEFNAKIKEKGFYKLGLSPSNFLVLVLDSTEHVNIEAVADSLVLGFKITNSAENELMGDYYTLELKLTDSFDSLSHVFKEFAAKDSSFSGADSVAKALDKTYAEMGKKNAVKVKALLDKNPTMFANLYGANMLNPDDFIPELEKLATNLKKAYPQSFHVDNFANRIEASKRIAIGQPAPDITMMNTADEKVSLSSLKGKLVLVDFWASWCGPCRKENPNVVKIYNKYKEKGFTIFSVSLDDKKENWLKAIKDDKLTWTHVSDLAGWSSIAPKLYNFNVIPTTYLVDRNGNILNRNLRGQNLEDAVAAYFLKEAADTLHTN